MEEGMDPTDGATNVRRNLIGTNLRALREMRGLSLADVAAKVDGVKADSLCNWEKGKTGISYESAWKLADFYGVSLEALRGNIAFQPAAAC